MKNSIFLSKEELLERLWQADPHIKKVLRDSKHIEEARHLRLRLFQPSEPLHVQHEARHLLCGNEHLTQASPLQLLYDLAHDPDGALARASEAFLCEHLSFFRGITGKAGKHSQSQDLFEMKDGREAALIRSSQLDEYAAMIRRYFRRYRTGFDRSVVKRRKGLKKDILAHFQATEAESQDYLWHLKHIIKNLETLSALVTLDKDEIAGLKAAKEYGIPVEITPYYLSLFNKDGKTDYDR